MKLKFGKLTLHWGEEEIIDGMRNILDGTVERNHILTIARDNLQEKYDELREWDDKRNRVEKQSIPLEWSGKRESTDPM